MKTFTVFERRSEFWITTVQAKSKADVKKQYHNGELCEGINNISWNIDTCEDSELFDIAESD